MVLCGVLLGLLVEKGFFQRSSTLRWPAQRLLKGPSAELSFGRAGELLISREDVERLALSRSQEGTLVVSLTLDAPGLPDALKLKREDQDERVELSWLGLGAVLSWRSWARLLEPEGGEGHQPDAKVRWSGFADGLAQRWSVEIEVAVYESASPEYIAEYVERLIEDERARLLQVVRWFTQLSAQQLITPAAQEAAPLRRLRLAILRTEARFAPQAQALYESLLIEGDWEAVLILLTAERIEALEAAQREQALVALVDQPEALIELIGPLLAPHLHVEQLSRLIGRSPSLRLMIILVWHEEKLRPAQDVLDGLEAVVTGLDTEQLQEVLSLVCELDELDRTSFIERLRFVPMDRPSIGGLLRLLGRHRAQAPQRELTALMARAIVKAMARANSFQLSRLSDELIARGALSSVQVLREELGAGWMNVEVEQACRQVLSRLHRRLGGHVEQGQLSVVDGSAEHAGALSQAVTQGGALKIVASEDEDDR